MEIKIIEYRGRKLSITHKGDVYSEPFISSDGRQQNRRKLNPQVDFRGYVRVGFRANGKKCKASVHRLVAQAFLPDYSERLQVDHINGERRDNRVDNLRMATSSQNHRAYRKKRKYCSSKYRGVRWQKSAKKWAAQIKCDEKLKHLGLFATETEAAKAFNEAAIKNGYHLEALNKL